MLEIWQDLATELNKEAFLSVKEESFPPHLSGLEKIIVIMNLNQLDFLPLTGVM